MEYHLDYQKEAVEKTYFDRELIRKLWYYLKPNSWKLFGAILALLIAKSIEAAVPLLLGDVTQKLFNERGVEALSVMVDSCLWIMGLLVVSYLFDSGSVIVKNWVGQQAIFSLRNEVYYQIIHLPLRYYDQQTFGRLMTRTVHDIDQLNHMFSENAVPMIGNLVLFLGIIIGSIYLDPRIGLVMAVMLPFALYHVNHFRVNQQRCFRSIRSIVSAMNGFVQEYLMGAITIRRFGLHEKEKRHFEEINDDYASAYKKTIHYFAFFYAGIDLLQSFSLIAVFGILAAFSADFQAGTYFTFSLYALMLFRPLADLAERYNELQSAIASAERIFNVMEQRREDSQGSKTLAAVHEIVFDDVWFAYSGEEWVLKGLSFKIEKGESVALVGPTGAGKSSILSLLLGFYDFQKGRITINGVDLRLYSLASLRRQFSVVLQDPVIFSGTLEDNIALGEPVDAEGVVKRLGLEHLPRRLSERGASLSVGERQLVAMARALAHCRSVFMLDEATASVDSETEAEIQKALKVLIRESTSLVIAHRLSTIKDVKRILVLNEGVVAEEGSHQKLLEKKGLYEKLYRLQFMD